MISVPKKSTGSKGASPKALVPLAEQRRALRAELGRLREEREDITDSIDLLEARLQNLGETHLHNP